MTALTPFCFLYLSFLQKDVLWLTFCSSAGRLFSAGVVFIAPVALLSSRGQCCFALVLCFPLASRNCMVFWNKGARYRKGLGKAWSGNFCDECIIPLKRNLILQARGAPEAVGRDSCCACAFLWPWASAFLPAPGFLFLSAKRDGICLLWGRKRAIWIKYYLEACPHPVLPSIFAEYEHCCYLLFVLGCERCKLWSSARFHRAGGKCFEPVCALALARFLQLPAARFPEKQVGFTQTPILKTSSFFLF